MKHRLRIPMVALAAFAVVALGRSPAIATFGEDEYRMRLWMLPPMDTIGNNACLTNDWHGTYFDVNRALDWKGNCGAAVHEEVVRFRSLGADIDSDPTSYWAGAYGVAANMTLNCGSGTEHVTRVQIWANWPLSPVAKGSMYYVHSVKIPGLSNFSIWFTRGGSLTSGSLTNVNIANTVDDSSTGTCWGGFHVHENNSDDAGSAMKWDSWNTAHYDGEAPPSTDTFKNSSSANWIRRMTWINLISE